MLTPETTCLIVIDIQEKLFNVMAEPEPVRQNTVILIEMSKALEIPILWCQQVPKALGPTIEPVLTALEGLQPCDKTTFSCCRDAAFAQKLNERKPKTAILCGIETHVCVFQTARDLLEKGVAVQVVADATTSRTEANKQIALDRMRQEDITVSSTEMCLFELLADSKHEKFRELSKLIK